MILSRNSKWKRFTTLASSSSRRNQQSSLSLAALLKSGFNPTLKHYNKFLAQLFKTKNFRYITHFISQLNSNQIVGDQLTHSIFTRALLKQHNYEKAVEFINSQIGKTPAILQNRILDSIIQGFCVNAKDPEKGFSVLQDYLKIDGIFPSSFTFCALVSSFSRQGKMDRAIEVLEIMSDEKFKYPFDNFVCSSVVSGFVNIGKFELAVEFYENAAKSAALQMNVVTYTCLVSAYCRLGKFEEVSDLVGRIEKDGLAFDVVFYGSLIYEYFRAGIVMEALQKHKEMVERRIELDTISYTILIDGFSKEGLVEKAVGFLYLMRKEGTKPNLITYTTIMLGFCKKAKLDKAFTMFRMAEDLGMEVDEFAYATLIDGLCRVRDFDGAFRLLDEMNEKGVHPSVVTYNTIINGLCKAGRTNEAYEVSRGILGDAVTYSTLLHGYIEEKDSIGMVMTKSRLEEAGVRMDVVMCNILIKALFMVGSFEDAFGVYKRMPEMGLAANHITYCTLLDGYCKFGRIDEALEVFDEFRRTSMASVACYNCIINGLCKNNMTDMAIQVFIELNERGLPLDAGIHRMLFKSILRAAGPEGILEFIFKIEKLGHEVFYIICNFMDVVDYTIIVDGLCKEGRIRKALEVCAFAKKNGVTLNIVTYNSIIHGLCRQGCFVEAFRLFDSLEKINVSPSEITYSTLIDALCKEGYLLDAKTFFERMILKGLKPNIRVHNSLINGYGKLGQLPEALKLVADLDENGIRADGFTVSAVINGFCRNGNMEAALEYYFDSRTKGFLPDLLGFFYLIRGLCSKGRMEESRSVLTDMLQTENVVDLLTKVDTRAETEPVDRFLGSLCDQGNIREAITILDEIVRTFFPVGKRVDEGKLGTAGSEPLISSNEDKAVYDDFDTYYGLLASLCSRGELKKANKVAKLLAGARGG